MLIDLLNRRVTPVMQSRGTVGEGDLSVLDNIGATMVGAGDAYYQGTRMSAARCVEGGGPVAAATFRRRRQRAHQQQRLCHRAGRVRRRRCEAGAGVGGSHLRDRFECHEQLGHAAQLSSAERPAVQMAELGRRPRQGDDQGKLSVRRRQGPHHPGPGKPACLLDPSSVRMADVGDAARRCGHAAQLVGSQSGDPRRHLARRIPGS